MNRWSIDAQGSRFQEFPVDGNRGPGPFLETQLEPLLQTNKMAFWEANGVDLALTNLERIQKTLLGTVVLLREERIPEAGRLLRHCLEALDRMVETISFTRKALTVDCSKIQIEGKDLASLEIELLHLKEKIGTSWASDEFEPLVDRLEYELVPHLAHWARLLRKLIVVPG
jgi:hypothetical protein